MGRVRRKKQSRSIATDHAVRRKRGFRVRRLVPFLVFAAVAVVILRDEVPAVHAFIERFLQPQRYPATEACIRAAKAEGDELLHRGSTQSDGNGHKVTGVTVRDRRSDESWARVTVSCELDSQLQVISIGRTYVLPETAPPKN